MCACACASAFKDRRDSTRRGMDLARRKRGRGRVVSETGERGRMKGAGENGDGGREGNERQRGIERCWRGRGGERDSVEASCDLLYFQKDRGRWDRSNLLRGTDICWVPDQRWGGRGWGRERWMRTVQENLRMASTLRSLF